MGLVWASCASAAPTLEPAHASLLTSALVITEVAQASSFGSTTADKVEVYCAAEGGCPEYKVCDSGSACSALQQSLAPHARAVISRGTSITTSDQVWLASSIDTELPGSRGGPFDCANAHSQSRRDCESAAFEACAAPGLGISLGDCESDPGPQPFTYSVRFTTNQQGQPEELCARPVCQELLAAIRGARASIDFAIYGIRGQDHIIDALAEAQARGVVVRGVVDTEDAPCTTFGYVDTPQLITALEPGSVTCDRGPGHGDIMHNKFFVLDGQTVWTGSTNISDTELGGEYSTDVAVMLSSSRLAEVYRVEFEEMFVAGLFHNRKSDNTPHVLEAESFSDGTRIRSYFSPTDAAIDNAVIPLIESATTTLDIAMFYFTSQPIADAIVAAAGRGVSVRMILDATGAGNVSSKHSELCAHGLAVKIENWGGKSHSKWAVADAEAANAAVVFGSMNWTVAGNSKNDENTLFVQHTGFAEVFRQEFERQWADLGGVPACVRAAAEGADSSVCDPGGCQRGCSSGSCCDGVDNDHDGYLDGDDFDCVQEP